MIDKYDILNTFYDMEYWEYDCPGGGETSLISTSKLRQYNKYSLDIHIFDERGRDTTIKFPYIDKITFHTNRSKREIKIKYYGYEGNVEPLAIQTLNMGVLEDGSILVNLTGDGEIISSRVLIERGKIRPEQERGDFAWK